ncbi:MAG TPA: hypothetical protein PLR60_01175 [Syntrophorhabdaceae bacterium]|nr:hypothetical protein [Syntrophorhabdaceae bacterium]
MKFRPVLLLSAVLLFASLECGAQLTTRSSAPAAKNPANPGTTRSAAVPSAGRVINTQTFTITGAPSATQPFSPVTVNTAALTITGAAAPGKFSPVTVNTQTLTITGVK